MVACQILKTGEIAKRWHRSREFVQSLIRSGKLQPVRRWEERAHYRVSLDEVLIVEQQLAQAELERQKNTALAKMLGINKRYVKGYFLDH